MDRGGAGPAEVPGAAGTGRVRDRPGVRAPGLRDPGAGRSGHPYPGDGTFAVIPAGNRTFYCLGRRGYGRNPALALPPGFDICTTPLAAEAFAARDSGQPGYFPYPNGKQTWLAIETPFYAANGVPPTVAARRASFIGWVGTAIEPAVVLDGALRGHPGMAVTLRYGAGSAAVSFSGGAASPAGQTMAIQLPNGWTVVMHGKALPTGLLSSGPALGVLLARTVLSLLAGLLIAILATGRARAWRMVGPKTEELRYQALHDGLTGLPSRALILDRLEGALARARRQKTSLAVMFLDLDGFKDVNDSHGHAAGDRLLCEVARRLGNSVRDSDTVGRLGGDEFVVVVESESMADGPEALAARIHDGLALPFVLPGEGQPTLYAPASIGIAVGIRPHADDLLRDADVALYEAKARGKDRYVMFVPEPTAIRSGDVGSARPVSGRRP